MTILAQFANISRRVACVTYGALAFLSVPVVLRAQAKARPLSGIAAIRAHVRYDRSPNDPEINVSRIDSALTKRLQRASWRLVDESTHPSAPLVFVGIALVPIPVINMGNTVVGYAVRAECTVTEQVKRLRDGAIVPATTWSAGNSVSVIPIQADLTVSLAAYAEACADRIIAAR